MAAKEEGDARYALDLLRTAGEIADEEESDKIIGDYVRRAKDRIEHNKITDVILTLPTQQQRVLDAILRLTQNNEATYEEIKKACINACAFDFINELEMLGIISTNTISRGRGKGRTNIITLQCDTDLLEKTLYSI